VPGLQHEITEYKNQFERGPWADFSLILVYLQHTFVCLASCFQLTCDFVLKMVSDCIMRNSRMLRAS